jgi:hypothetical protein
MNTFSTHNTEYIWGSKTIEIVLVSDSIFEKLFYVYNYEGNSFSVFKTIISLIQFFEKGTKCDEYFETDYELDNYFSNVELSQ